MQKCTRTLIAQLVIKVKFDLMYPAVLFQVIVVDFIAGLKIDPNQEARASPGLGLVQSALEPVPGFQS